MPTSPFNFLLGATLGLLSFGLVRGDDHVDWVQLHATVSYERSGPPLATTNGNFTYHLEAELDQLMVRVAPGQEDKWPSYVLLDEYPRVGRLAGSIHFSGSASVEKFSASAALNGELSSLDSLWIDSVKPQRLLGPGLTAEIKLAAKVAGKVVCDLPGGGSDPKTAIFVWPTPIKYSDEVASFITEGSLYLRPPFGPRPLEAVMAGYYDLAKSAAELNLPGLGGLTAPSLGAVLTGNPAQWELSLDREEKTEPLEPITSYTHHVKIRLRLVPTTLKPPAALP